MTARGGGAFHDEPLGNQRAAVMKRILLCCIPVLVAAALPGTAAEPPAMDPPAPVVAKPEADPKAVALKVEQALKTAEGVPSTGITVTTHASVIVLNGKVASQAEMARAEAVAKSAAGDMRVSSQIEVVQPAVDGPSQQAAASLVKNVEDALKRDMATANLGVTVSIDDQQTIGLYGLVPSREARSAVERVAARVQGVRKIDSRLVVPGG
jgi:osmotically-inducible protein OsmY